MVNLKNESSCRLILLFLVWKINSNATRNSIPGTFSNKWLNLFFNPPVWFRLMLNSWRSIKAGIIEKRKKKIYNSFECCIVTLFICHVFPIIPVQLFLVIVSTRLSIKKYKQKSLIIYLNPSHPSEHH